MDKYLIVVVGPTASGKTDLSINLAKKFNTVVVSADSRQFFKEMHIGTARPLPEEWENVEHYFLGSHSIHEEYNIGKYEEEVMGLLNELYHKKNIVVMAGGSGLYVKMICEGLDEMPEGDSEIREELQSILEEDGIEKLTEELKSVDPEYYQQVDLSNPQRVIRALEVYRSTGIAFSDFRKGEKKQRDFKTIKIGINWDREMLYERINRRVDQMIEKGLFTEAKSLYNFRNLNALQTVGYKEIFDYLDGQYDQKEAIRLIKRNTRRFAKRQMTWFRRDQDIVWFDPGSEDKIIDYIKKKIGS